MYWCWVSPLITARKKVNMKTVTLNVKGISQGQWSSFLLELNLMNKAWKPYAVEVELKAHRIKRIIPQGTSNGESSRKNKRSSK